MTRELITIPRFEFVKSFTCTSVCDTGFYFGILAKRVTDKELKDREEGEEQDQYWTSLSDFCRIFFFSRTASSSITYLLSDFFVVALVNVYNYTCFGRSSS